MKKIMALVVACLMIVSLAVVVSAYWEPEEAFGEVKFTIGKQTTAWNADGKISDGEYYKVEIDPSWISYAINDNDTDAGLEYAKATHPELYMSWDENYIYTATRYEVTKGHENLWDGDPASMWYSGAVQFNYANFDEVASEYRLEYGVGLSSDTGDMLYTVWADGAGTGFTPSEENAKVWLDGNTLTYETKVAWEDFADEDNTAGKEGLGFNFCLVWSIGEGQDYVHIQLAEGCTGNGKHAENFAQVTLGPAPEASSNAAAAGESAFEEIWVTADQEFYDDPETLFEGGSGQPIQYVEGYGVGYSSLNDQVIFRDIDFGANGADKMLINFSNGGGDDTTLAIYIDEKSGDPDATFTIPNTGGWEAVWAEDFETAIDVKSGVHDVIIEFTNSNSGSFYYIKFFEKGAGAAGEAAPVEYKAVGEVSVPYATPTIDGVISEGEYPETGKVILNQSNMTALGWVGEVPAENSIELYYAWDKDNFYLAGNVTDPAFEYSNPGQYDMDAFQVSLNIGNVFKTDEGFDRAIFYSWGLQEEGTIDVIRQESANNDTIFEVGKGQKTDTGWCFEVPLSLEMLAEDAYLKGGEEAIPEPGMPIGGLFCYLDHDDVGTLINAFGTSTDEVMGWDPDAHGITFMFAEKPEAAPVYPASGTEGNAIIGTVIGNETGWGDNAAAGAAAAFDGDVATFFDPLGVGDGFCGIDAGESYILDKVVIMSRADWNARFKGAMIQGSNDGENWTTLWTSEGEGTNPDWYTVTEFENNTGYSQFRYYNTTEHGDVAEVEFYGNPGAVAAEAPGFATADEAIASIGKTAISGYEFVTGAEGAFGGEGPENLWDGDTATKLCTNTLPASSTAKLDGSYTIDGVTIALANDNAEYGRVPTDWTLSGSTDGENWTVITTGDDSMFVKDNGNFRYFAKSFDASEAYSYVKIDIAGSTDDIVQISEVVLTGAKAAAPVDQALDQKAEAPNTFDFGVVAAVAAVISLGGFAVSKKKH